MSTRQIHRLGKDGRVTSTNAIRLQVTGSNFLADHAGENPLRFKLGQLREDARLGSRGEDHGTVDDVARKNRGETKCFLCWFLVHTRRA
jgi:hypothetical protein